jgi:hypothetical protein
MRGIDKSILMPIIRNVMPNVIANHITGVQPMTGAAGKIFNLRSNYRDEHTFNPNYWPHVKTLPWDKMFKAERWCYDNLKSRNWRNQGVHFAFKREQDYMMFMLACI